MYNKYILANEDRPNNFNPIYWNDLKSIDNFTKDFTFGEFIKYLKLNGLLDGYRYNFQIVFNNNGVRKVSDGVMFKEDYNPNMLLFVKEYIINNISNANYLNEIFQNINSDKQVEDLTKSIVKVIFDNRHLNLDELNIIINELDNCPYYDI